MYLADGKMNDSYCTRLATCKKLTGDPGDPALPEGPGSPLVPSGPLPPTSPFTPGGPASPYIREMQNLAHRC